ncbi:hypothetical protein AAVH_11440 [Aphelenchoides avenae]|nr:hypothetical protein AAVH_11440 [Aphelenchus avenae]
MPSPRERVNLQARKFIRTTVTVGLITASHFILLALPDILYFTTAKKVVSRAVLKNMITSQGLVNVFIYLFMQPDLRPWVIVRRKVNKVSYAGTSRIGRPTVSAAPTKTMTLVSS